MTSRALVALALIFPACGEESVDGTTDTSAGDTSENPTDATSTDEISEVSPTVPSDSSSDTTLADTTIPEGPIGGARPARVVLPLDYAPGTPAPLVLLLHGYGVTGDIQDAYLGFSEKAARAGFVTIIPDGMRDGAQSQFWNADPAWCCNFADVPIDDVAYLTGLITEAQALWSVDATRVYAFGHSNGGFMAHKLACAEADTFAAIASLAGSLPASVSACDPSSPVAMLQIHGTSDSTIVYAGNADYPGAVAIADRWVSYNGCTGDPTGIAAVDYDSNIVGSETTGSTWATCDGGAEVGLWTMTTSSHIPSVADSNFIADVLTFFARHDKAQ